MVRGGSDSGKSRGNISSWSFRFVSFLETGYDFPFLFVWIDLDRIIWQWLSSLAVSFFILVQTSYLYVAYPDANRTCKLINWSYKYFTIFSHSLEIQIHYICQYRSVVFHFLLFKLNAVHMPCDVLTAFMQNTWPSNTSCCRIVTILRSHHCVVVTDGALLAGVPSFATEDTRVGCLQGNARGH